jgi:glutamate synthase (NADPH) small chain
LCLKLSFFMPNPKGFLEYTRETPATRPVNNRLNDYKELYENFSEEKTQNQAERCMDCGVPFCHNGCPLGNIIPEFNESVREGNWREAYEILSSTNNFPEFTGRICPAPCESACVLGINQPAVAIEHIEKTIAEIAFERQFIQPPKKAVKTGKKIAIVGSGPAGLAAADQLNKAGHTVTVFEKSDKLGGLLQYGIPDFKLEKWVVERRISVMKSAGIEFVLNAHIGSESFPVKKLETGFDAIILAIGTTIPRDLALEGRHLNGIHYAMTYLEQSNRAVSGQKIEPDERIFTEGKNVVVIGGGDTGSDCIGTANRQNAAGIIQLDYHLKPSLQRDSTTPWPLYPKTFRTSSSQEEGCDRQFSVQTQRFVADETGKNLKGVEIVELAWKFDAQLGKNSFMEVPNSTKILPADFVFIAIGFKQPNTEGLAAELGLELTPRGTISSENFATSNPKVFTCGDAHIGQSLVVTAISEGRECARSVDFSLMGATLLPGKAHSFLAYEKA